ncbi:MAG: ABC transporter permease subunit, partial [Candidatus Kariarchaeaceae archaeon]
MEVKEILKKQVRKISSHRITEKLKKQIRQIWSYRITKILVYILLGFEGIVMGLFLLNGMFAGMHKFVPFHIQVWKILLKTSTFDGMIVIGMPIMLTAIGAAFNERAGVINIGLQGIMIFGAFAAAYFTYEFGSPWYGVLGAILFGIIVSGIHAIMTITFKAEQIVTGV